MYLLVGISITSHHGNRIWTTNLLNDKVLTWITTFTTWTEQQRCNIGVTNVMKEKHYSFTMTTNTVDNVMKKKYKTCYKIWTNK